MKNINLKDRDLKNNRGFNKKTVNNFGIGIILITSVIYGTLFVLNKKTTIEIQEIEKQKKVIEDQFKKDPFSEMFSFYNILTDLDFKMNGEKSLPQTQDLLLISKNTLPEVRLISFLSEAKSLSTYYEIEMIVPSNEILVKQSRAYEEMENSHNFFLRGTDLQEGEIVAVLSFNLGNIIE